MLFKIQECAKVAFYHAAELLLQLKDYEVSEEKKSELRMVFAQIIRDQKLEEGFGKEELKTILFTCKKVVCYVSLKTNKRQVDIQDSIGFVYAANGGQAVKVTFNILIKVFQLWRAIKGV